MRTIAPIIAALITGTVALTVGVLAYVFGRLQKEYEVRFTRLHERQAEVVAELYQLHHQTLADYRRWDRHNELGDYRSRNIAHRSAGKKLNRFSVLYEEQDILISPWLWLRLHNFYRGARKALSDSAMFNVERKAPTGKGIHTFLRTSEFSNLAEELKAEYEEVLGISGSRSRTGRGVLLPPMLRLVGGLVGAALIGLGVSGIICVAAGIGDPIILCWGAIVGLGVGLLLEYVRPTLNDARPTTTVDSVPDRSQAGSQNTPSEDDDAQRSSRAEQ